MNIFAVDRNPKIAAQMMCDQHVVKMIIESMQMLASVIDSNYKDECKGANSTPPSQTLGMYGYPKSVPKHPCTQWVAKSLGNYKWLVKHTRALCMEYSKRYGKVHASEGMLMIVEGQMQHLDFEIERKTEFVQALPDQIKSKNPIKAYRDYYNLYKFTFAKWRKCTPAPSWFTGGPFYFISLEKTYGKFSEQTVV